ncbi:MAG TPA: (Fe-S)-binding protein [Anaeromyxobacteraceae bacterium]|nr:(Fe-S)-binding protein [Anaeromyxobacteraceae bacterium]
MDATREIYWNVGRGVIAPMYAVALAAAAVFAWGLRQRLRVWRLGAPEARLQPWGARLAGAARAVLGQGTVLRALLPGSAHALLLWSFLLLFAGTLLVMAQADLTAPLLGVTFLRGGFYRAYSLALDVAGLVAVGAVAVLLARRLALRGRLETRAADLAVLAALLAILLTGFATEAVRIAATELRDAPDLARASPVGRLLALPLAGWDGGALRALHRALWWGHLLLAAAALAAIPFTKLRHVVVTPAGLFAGDRRPRGALATLDLEAEGVERFGAATVGDLSWKDLLDADACTGCQRCQDRCPAHASGKPLSPMRLVRQVGEAARAGGAGAALVAEIGADAIWSCTTCYACQDGCPAGVEHVGKVLALRRNLALMEGAFPGEEVRTAADHVEVNGNPFGFDHAARGDWAKELGVPVVAPGEAAGVEVLYFAGCQASFDRRAREVAKSFVRICRAAGVSVGVLGKEERCCGEPLRKLGNEYLYQQAARANIEAIRARAPRRIVTTCPHCLQSLGFDYRDLGLEVEVEHHSTFVERLVAEGRLKLAPGALEVTYHDPCQLGRYRGVYDAPRRLLGAAGATVVEMARSRRDAACCGAGGGRMLAEERLGTRINAARVEMARETGAPVIAAACPFCLSMLEDGIKAAGEGERMVARDVAEIVAERLGG